MPTAHIFSTRSRRHRLFSAELQGLNLLNEGTALDKRRSLITFQHSPILELD